MGQVSRDAEQHDKASSIDLEREENEEIRTKAKERKREKKSQVRRKKGMTTTK